MAVETDLAAEDLQPSMSSECKRVDKLTSGVECRQKNTGILVDVQRAVVSIRGGNKPQPVCRCSSGNPAVYASFTPETAMEELLAHFRYYGIPFHAAMSRLFVATRAQLPKWFLTEGANRKRMQIAERRLLGCGQGMGSWTFSLVDWVE